MVIALHILNFSLDAPDATNSAVAENLSFNEIESFTEWFAEEVLNIEDAFSEADEQGDEESGFIKKIVDIKFYQVVFEDETITPSLINIKNNIGRLREVENNAQPHKNLKNGLTAEPEIKSKIGLVVGGIILIISAVALMVKTRMVTSRPIMPISSFIIVRQTNLDHRNHHLHLRQVTL
jgi:hypothetical protein